MQQLDLFNRLPYRPYCADAKDARRLIRTRAAALRRPYIQPNAPAVRHWLVYDVDRPQAALAWEDNLLPPPSFSVARRDRDDSAHLWYGMNIPISIDPENASRAMRYAAAVELGMTRQMGADLAYSGQLAKTPDHPEWRTYYGPGLYDLDDLAGYIRDMPRLPTRHEAIRTGIGRNVALFDVVRFWAYRHARDFKHTCFDTWHAAVRDRAQHCNADMFPDPLPGPEVNHTAKSIARWVWLQQRARDKTWTLIQTRRSHKAEKARVIAKEATRSALLADIEV